MRTRLAAVVAAICLLVAVLAAPASSAPKKHWNLYQDKFGAYTCSTADPKGQTLIAHPFGNQAQCLAAMTAAPVIAWSGNIADGDSFYIGSVPAEPTCSVIGEKFVIPTECVVTGYDTAVGNYTLEASATNVLGLNTTEQRGYTVMLRPAEVIKPGVTDEVCASPGNVKLGGITIPNVEGIDYSIDGNQVGPGFDDQEPGTYHVTAKAQDGYELVGYPDGGWSLTVKGADPEGCIYRVTAAAPTATDETDGASGGITITASDGVDYFIDGNPVDAGFNALDPGMYEVTAEPKSGYVIDGDINWFLGINAYLNPTTPVEPTKTDQTCGGPGEVVTGGITTPAMMGVNYFIDGEPVTGEVLGPPENAYQFTPRGPGTYQVTAEAVPGWVLTDYPEGGWPLTVAGHGSPYGCYVPITPPGPSVTDESCDGATLVPGSLNIPNIEHVTYYLGPWSSRTYLTPGSHEMPAGTYGIYADLDPGYIQVSGLYWSRTIAPATCLIPVTPTPPVVVDETCDASGSIDLWTTMPGGEIAVHYYIDGSPAGGLIEKPPGTYQITASAMPGYVLEGYPAGGWTVEILPKGDCRTPTTPVAPMAINEACDGAVVVPGGIYTPAQMGVNYFIDGVPASGAILDLPGGTYQFAPLGAGDYLVTAEAATEPAPGWVLTDYPEGGWPLTVGGADCLIPVTPAAPTFVQSSCGGPDAALTIPDTEGVEYYWWPDSGNGVALPGTYAPHSWFQPWTARVTATAKPGYVLEGTTEWNFAADAPYCPVTPVDPIAVAETCDASGGVQLPPIAEGVGQWMLIHQGDTQATFADDGFVPFAPGEVYVYGTTTAGYDSTGPSLWTLNIAPKGDCVSDGWFKLYLSTGQDGLAQGINGGGITEPVDVFVNDVLMAEDVAYSGDFFEWWPESYTFVPNDVVRVVGDDGFYKELVVADLSVDVINGATGHVEGTCTVGMDVALEYSTDEAHPNPTQLTVPCIDGRFQGDFAPNELPNYPEGSFVEARQFDDDGDLTQVDAWYPQYLIPVSAGDASVVPETCEGQASGINVSASEGVQYTGLGYVDGIWTQRFVGGGFTAFDPGQDVTVRLEALPGYELIGANESGYVWWYANIPPAPDCVVTVTDPAFYVYGACPYVNGSITIPSVPHATYWLSSNYLSPRPLSPQEWYLWGTWNGTGSNYYYVWAVADSGYTLEDYTGPWTYMVPSCVIPQTPMANEETCPSGGGGITIPDVQGVDYYISGWVAGAANPGFYNLPPGSFTVSAQAESEMYRLYGQSEWTLEVAPATGCLTPVDVVVPQVKNEECNENEPGVVIPGYLTIPDVAGVDYFINHSGPVQTGTHEMLTDTPFQVTAAAQPGYELVGYPAGGWSLEVMAADCLIHVTPETPTANDETCDRSGSISLPYVFGVDYVIEGVNSSSQGYTYDVAPGTYSVYALAWAEGYVLDGTTTWELTVAPATDCSSR